MDLQDWELLSADGLVHFHGDGGGGGGGEGKFFSRQLSSYSDSFVDTDYFRCPSPKSWNFVDPSGDPKQILPVAIQLESRTEKEPDPDDESLKEITDMVVDEFKVKEKVEPPDMVEVEDQEEDQRSQVFFKKPTENEFADMKMDSPKFSAGVKGFVPTIDAFFFEEDTDVKKQKMDSGSNWEEEDAVRGGVNIWKWGLTGVGALCSFGVAAATVCVLILGNRHCGKQNQNFGFQIYTDDKRIKQVVHHATKLNEAISAVRGGVPMTGAHITFGGYYDGL